jgi:hypothetical protein
MWSGKYNSGFGAVKDSYHRIVQKMSLSDLMDEEWFSTIQEYVGGYHLRHLMFEIDMSCTDAQNDDMLVCIEQKLTYLSDMTSSDEKILYTIEVINHHDDDALIARIVNIVKPSILLLRRLQSRDSTLESLGRISAIFDEMKIRDIAIGLSGIPSTEIQYCLNAQRGVIKFLCLGRQLYPNIQVHNAELAHAHGCNTLLTVTNIDSQLLSGLDYYSNKYNRSNTLVLIKAILQMGTLVAFPKTIDPVFMRNYGLRLGHPFTHSQVVMLYVSSLIF